MATQCFGLAWGSLRGGTLYRFGSHCQGNSAIAVSFTFHICVHEHFAV